MSSAATASATNRGIDGAVAPQPAIQTLEVRKELLIQAPLEITWESLLEELGPEAVMPDGTKYPRVLEAFPGGRWYRDLGNNTGHFWGHVQVIKPPTLLEICGPMFMSYPVASHLQYRLTAEGNGATRLSFVHQAVGLIDPKHAEGVNKGWEFMNNHVRRIAEAKAGK
jgi:uncharacterized protein YndB with AHSA1/START domain